MESVEKNTRSGEPNYVSFRVANQDYCVEIMDVREIRRWSPTTILPKSPSHICGVINLRGAVVPILDFSVRIGLSPSKPTDRNVIVIVMVGQRSIGLLVDEVSDIMNVSDDEIELTQSMSAGGAGQIVTGVIVLGEQMIRIVNLDRLCIDTVVN